jgi:hypothetical protein
LPVQQHGMEINIHRHHNVDGIILDRYLQFVFLSAWSMMGWHLQGARYTPVQVSSGQEENLVIKIATCLLLLHAWTKQCENRMQSETNQLT